MRRTDIGIVFRTQLFPRMRRDVIDEIGGISRTQKEIRKDDTANTFFLEKEKKN